MADYQASVELESLPHKEASTASIPATNEEQLEKDYYNKNANFPQVKKQYLLPPRPKEKKEPEGEEKQEPLKKKSKAVQNKNRKHEKVADQYSLCRAIANGEVCTRADCRYGHDLQKYLETKPEDLDGKCPCFEKFGKCKFGYTCRYLKTHLSPEGKLIVDEAKMANSVPEEENKLERDLCEQLRRKKTEFPGTKRAEKIISQISELQRRLNSGKKIDELEDADADGVESEPTGEQSSKAENSNNTQKAETLDDLYVKDRPSEIKKVEFKGKLYLAPLTTVGNLPFRRICKQFGADITIGEMAMAANLLTGQASEWALLRRHKSEDIFGIQLAGNSWQPITKMAELISTHVDCDFVDINCGCPIDLLVNQGAGSGLLERANRLSHIIRGCVTVLNKPLTIKLRTGVKNDLIAHKLIAKYKHMGVAAFTLHGRTRKQRYHDFADWDYIEKCAVAAGDIPLFGNGDILSYEDYRKHMENPNNHILGVMIARGALIKPWVFNEIKEKKLWDISSRERLDIMRDYANYGLEHWGSDTMGVNNTRRFLLEWMSFLHRYIPVGLLEVVPQLMIHKAPLYYGRDELETLFASPIVSDWVKVTEMFLGKAPADFHFIPKHKANNATESEG